MSAQDLDYEAALLLHYQQNKSVNLSNSLAIKNTQSDYQIAKELQTQFEHEQQIERPSNNLVYKLPNTNDKSKCLVDPSWELVDPTPDVHVLFTEFNKKFFWNKLGSVTVSWSKKMTSCAGICSYQGFGGLCSVTLSEPLLKLRPRKDLVETLLHELIHAFLFITQNNRDRDGHGPEFHKHMYRINSQAGTNITVYHDFHDEVKLYQQHWWKCNGPCKNKHPFFGTVKRAINRPPGPQDRWWNEHQTNCGGVFIKVKSPPQLEPEKKSALSSSTKIQTDDDEVVKSNNKNDIRKYFPINEKKKISQENSSKVSNTDEKPKKNENSKNNEYLSVRDHWQKKFNTDETQIRGIKRPNNLISTEIIDPKKFKLSTTNDDSFASVCSTKIVVEDYLEKSENINIINKNSINNDESRGENLISKNEPQDANFSKCSVCEETLTEENSIEHILNCTNTLSKKTILASTDEATNNDKNLVECPICSKKIEAENFNDHLDVCLEASAENTDKENDFSDNKNIIKQEIKSSSSQINDFTKEINNIPKKIKKEILFKKCLKCEDELNQENYDQHVPKCRKKPKITIIDDDDDDDDNVECPICNKKIKSEILNDHLDDCLLEKSQQSDKINLSEENKKPSTSSIINNDEDEPTYFMNCPICDKRLSDTDYDQHLANCIIKRCDLIMQEI